MLSFPPPIFIVQAVLSWAEPSQGNKNKKKFAERLRKEKFGVYLEEEAEMTKGGRNVTSKNHEIKTGPRFKIRISLLSWELTLEANFHFVEFSFCHEMKVFFKYWHGSFIPEVKIA